MTSNGQGQLCDSTGDCQTINVANNPCWSQTATQSGVTVSGSWNNCQLSSSNILTAIAQVSFSGSGQLSCTYNVTATPQ